MQGLWGVLWLPEAALGQILPVGDKRQFCCNSEVELEDHLGMDSEQTEYFFFFLIGVVLERAEGDCLMIMNSWNCALS